MKKLFTLSYVMLIGSLAWGQINKGTLLLGGSGNYSAGDRTEESAGTSVKYSYDTYSFGPSFGYFLANDIVFGIDIGIGGDRIKDRDLGDENKSSSIKIGLFGRYYISKLFIEIGGGLESQQSSFVSGGTGGSEFTSKFGGPFYHAGLGYMIFLSESVAFEPMVNYLGNNLTNDDIADQITKTGLFQLKVGLNFYLEK